MLVKGVISAVAEDGKSAEVILPEYEDAVTGQLKFYGTTKDGGEFVVVAFFYHRFDDGVIL